MSNLSAHCHGTDHTFVINSCFQMNRPQTGLLHESNAIKSETVGMPAIKITVCMSRVLLSVCVCVHVCAFLIQIFGLQKSDSYLA